MNDKGQKALRLLSEMGLRFTSSNAIPVEKASIQSAEFRAMQDAVCEALAAHSHSPNAALLAEVNEIFQMAWGEVDDTDSMLTNVAKRLSALYHRIKVPRELPPSVDFLSYDDDLRFISRLLDQLEAGQDRSDARVMVMRMRTMVRHAVNPAEPDNTEGADGHGTR